MFDKDYSFWGAHANKVELLTKTFNDNGDFKLFLRNIDLYMVAPIVGFLYGRTSSEDKKDNNEKKIALSQISPNIKILEYNYKIIMLLDKEYEDKLENRIDKAFRYYNTKDSKEDEDHYESYVRGGIDVIFEKTIQLASDEGEYIDSVYDFLDDFNERYNKNINKIDDLVELARN